MVCNDVWDIVIRYSDAQEIVAISGINLYCRKLVFSNQIKKVWNQKELNYLLSTGNDPLLCCVLKEGWFQVVKSSYLVQLSCASGCLKAVELLLSKDENINVCEGNICPLTLAIVSGYWKIVNLLLNKKKKVDPSINKNAAIKSACRNGHLQTVELLLKDERVNPSEDENCAIQMAFSKEHFEIVLLLMKNEKVNPFKRSLLDLKELKTWDENKVNNYFKSLLKK